MKNLVVSFLAAVIIGAIILPSMQSDMDWSFKQVENESINIEKMTIKDHTSLDEQYLLVKEEVSLEKGKLLKDADLNFTLNVE